MGPEERGETAKPLTPGRDGEPGIPLVIEPAAIAASSGARGAEGRLDGEARGAAARGGGVAARLEGGGLILLLVAAGAGKVAVGGTAFDRPPPYFLCLGDGDAAEIDAGLSWRAARFLPELVNGSLSIEKLRGCPRCLDLSAEIDLYWAGLWMGGGGPACVPLDALAASRAAMWMDRIAAELRDQGCRFWRAWAKSYLGELLFALAEAHHSGGTVAGGRVPRGEEPMAAVARYIQERHADPKLRLNELCAEFATNRTSLQREFKEYAGRTVADYLRTHRLAVARGLLESGRAQVGEIALAVGFRDQTGFARAFSKAYGLPPAAYRARVKEAADRAPDRRDP